MKKKLLGIFVCMLLITTGLSVDSDNKWRHNYWGRSRIIPRIILVRKYIQDFLWIPDFDIDWRPAREDIGV